MANNLSENNTGTDIKNVDILNLLKNKFNKLDLNTGLENFRFEKLDEEIKLIFKASKYADLALENLKENAKELINKHVDERTLVKICTDPDNGKEKGYFTRNTIKQWNPGKNLGKSFAKNDNKRVKKMIIKLIFNNLEILNS